MAELREKKAELEAAEAERKPMLGSLGAKHFDEAMIVVRSKQSDLLRARARRSAMQATLASHESELHQYKIQITKLLERHAAKVAEVFNESEGLLCLLRAVPAN